MIELQFLGAARTVTGAKFLVSSGAGRLLVDCGLFQGLKELRLRNWSPLPVSAEDLDAVVLTHAHIDHTGYLPRLVRQGFERPVYGTRGTVDLCRIMLPDAGQLQEEDARYANKAGFSKHKPALPLYTEQDAVRSLKLLRPVSYDREIEVLPGVTAEFLRAGHILGSSLVLIRIREEARLTRILFSGDLGRYDEPILKDPESAPACDYLLVESTYGDRTHEEQDPKETLARIINDTAARGGQLIIPAFAVGRTQQVLYLIRELEEEREIPILPVYVDSPMAIDATLEYINHREDHDLEMNQLMGEQINPLRPARLEIRQSTAASKALNSIKEPAIIISASGMATGGRVLHHLKSRLPDPKHTILFVGYQAEGTRGRRLLEGAREIKIHGEMVPVRARVEKLGGLSAHADSGEILRWLKSAPEPPRQCFVIHGELEASQTLGRRIASELAWDVMIPKMDESVQLGGGAG